MAEGRLDYGSGEGAALYDLLVSAEDCDGALRPAIEALCPLAGAEVVEVGAGTGRLTRLMVDAGARVLATEPSPAMLSTLRLRLGPDRAGAVRTARAAADALPAPDGGADLCIAGWVLGHQRGWYPDSWRANVQAALLEMRRVVRPGGRVVLIETMGTGAEEPAPPSAELAEFQDFLVDACGLQRAPAVRTDYCFADPEAARRAMGAFFGERGRALVRRFGHRRIPECTGLWWAHVEG